jgi:uncharacterized LabA/DUF88 family protein
MAVRYLFIDGGFLDSMIARTERDFKLPGPLLLNYRGFTGYNFERIFYYDAYPAPKEKQSKEEHAQLVAEKDRKFAMLNEIPFVHTREGITRNRTGKGSRLEQKGVDILLAIDAYRHAVQGNIEEAHILTTDLDFFPLLEALRDTRVATYLHCYMPETSPDLFHLADVVHPVNRLQMLERGGWHDVVSGLIESVLPESLNEPELIREGKLADLPVQLLRDRTDKGNSVFGRAKAFDWGHMYRGASADIVVEYFELQCRAPAIF